MYLKTTAVDTVIKPMYKKGKFVRLGYYKPEGVKKTLFVFLKKKKLYDINTPSFDNTETYVCEYQPGTDFMFEHKSFNSSQDFLSFLDSFDKIIITDKKQKYKLKKLTGDIDYIDIEDKISKITDIFNLTGQDTAFIFKSKNPVTTYARFLKDIEELIKFDYRKYKTVFSYIIYKSNRKTAKILVKKNYELDKNFERMYNDAYKDVFTHLETRKDRKIKVLDVNSMYPYLLTLTKYPHPAYLEYSDNITLEDLKSGKINNGVFRVKYTVENENDFTEKYNYLVCRLNNYSLSVKYKKGDVIETYSGYEEVLFYSKYFKTEIIEGTYSSKTIYTPLKKYVDDFYDIRLQLKEKAKKLNPEGTEYSLIKLEERVIKSILVSLASSMYRGRKKIKEKTFKNFKHFENYIKAKYLIDIRGKKDFSNKLLSVLRIRNTKGGIKVKYSIYERTHSGTVFSLFGTMFSLAKTLILKAIEELLSVKDEFGIEICYSNIDSLHVSFNADKEKEFEEWLVKKGLVTLSGELGKLKIEETAKQGLWLDIANYWLTDEKGKVVKFANMLPSEKRKMFTEKVIVKEEDGAGFPVYKKYELFKHLKYWKELINTDNGHITAARPAAEEICGEELFSSKMTYYLLTNVPLYKKNFYTFKNFTKRNGL